MVVVGTRAYLERHGRPRQPSELRRHQCILRSADAETESWPFRTRGRLERVRVAGRFSKDDASAVLEAAARGLGLARVPAWQVRELIDRGALERVLEDCEAPKLPVFALSPATKLPLPKTRLFIDLLAQRLKRERL